MAPSQDLLNNIEEDFTAPAAGNASEEAGDLDKAAELALKQQLVLIKREELKQLEQNRTERKKYAQHIFRFTCSWAIAIFVILLLSAWNKAWSSFDTSDKVLITLITSTTVNFFGFFLLVVKYLFNTDKKEKEKKKQEKEKAKKSAKQKEKLKAAAKLLGSD